MMREALKALAVLLLVSAFVVLAVFMPFAVRSHEPAPAPVDSLVVPDSVPKDELSQTMWRVDELTRQLYESACDADTLQVLDVCDDPLTWSVR